MKFPQLCIAFLLGGSLVLLVMRSQPSAPSTDDELVKSLLGENLSKRSFAFPTIASACSGQEVIPLDAQNPAHQRVTTALHQVLAATLAELNLPASPVRSLRRINEASRFFEDGIHSRLNAMPGIVCEVPTTRAGEHQRSGYPDLKITDQASHTIFYLDPKLVEQGSAESTFRSFYFEPKNETLKITDAAIHLLVGIEHDGADGVWNFTGWRLIDLSTLRVRLKAEFQASNAELYEGAVLSPLFSTPVK